MTENQEFIKEFIEECAENLDQLDQDLVALEKDPTDSKRLDSIFRSIHTIKGTSGFFGFSKLGALAHDGESLLSRVRDGELLLTQELASALLKLIDNIREILTSIEGNSTEGSGDYRELSATLLRLALSPGIEPAGDSSATQESAQPQPASDIPTDTDQRNTGGDGSAQLVEEQSVSADPSAPPGDATIASESEVEKSETSSQIRSEGSIRVDVDLLDKLIDLAGELVLARNRLNQFSASFPDRVFQNTAQRLSHITTELQEGVMQTRMLPIGGIWGKYPRIVRDLAIACGKDVHLEMEGHETELDRSLLEAIKDPLTHLIRNAVDHGIESPEVRDAHGKPRQGHVLLRATHDSGHVKIEISDDGGGIDHERVCQRALDEGVITSEQAAQMDEHEMANLIFRPGLSTAEKVTDVSGRGVGMDVVKTNVETIGGNIDLTSHLGQGTKVQIVIPLTLAIIPALIVTSANVQFAIPQASLLEILTARGDEDGRVIEWVHDAPVYRLRGELLPLIDLNRVMKIAPDRDDEPSACNIAVLQSEGRRFGLIVDRVNNTEEIVVKPLSRILKSIPVFAGATIMGDGSIALILDVIAIARDAGLSFKKIESSAAPADEPTTTEGPIDQYLICQIGDERRVALPLDQVERLEEIPSARIERASGQEVIQYRDGLMALVRLDRIFGEAEQTTSDSIQVIVHRRSDKYVGLVVQRILDAVDVIRDLKQAGDGGLIIGSTVIEEQVVDVVDIESVLTASGVRLFEQLVLP